MDIKEYIERVYADLEPGLPDEARTDLRGVIDYCFGEKIPAGAAAVRCRCRLESKTAGAKR